MHHVSSEMFDSGWHVTYLLRLSLSIHVHTFCLRFHPLSGDMHNLEIQSSFFTHFKQFCVVEHVSEILNNTT